MDDAPAAAARRLGDELLRPNAERVDVDGVPRSHLDALAAAGLFARTPVPLGRVIAEELAAADASTWFVWTQHNTPLRTVVRANAATGARWLPPMERGEVVAGVAYTHLRRPGPPVVTARRDGAGWVLDGALAWVTSWQLADVFLVGAQAVGARPAGAGAAGEEPGDDLVWVLLPLRGRDGVTARPLALAAMNGTSTVRVHLEGLRVDDEEVVLVEPLASWRATDAARTLDVSPAVLGITAEAVRRRRCRPSRRLQRGSSVARHADVPDRPRHRRVERHRCADRAGARRPRCRADSRRASHGPPRGARHRPAPAGRGRRGVSRPRHGRRVRGCRAPPRRPPGRPARQQRRRRHDRDVPRAAARR